MCDILRIMQKRELKYKELSSKETALREYEIRYRGSICPPTCVPIGTLSSRESLVLTNMARLISKIHQDIALTNNSSLKCCSPDTLYDFFEQTPSTLNDVENPIYQYMIDNLHTSHRLTEES